MRSDAGALIRGRFDPRVARVFGWISRRLLRKRFAAVRLVPGATEAAEAFGAAPGPSILLMSHAAWWDPIVFTVLHARWWPKRPVMGPMDEAELRRFRVFARVGLFGLDPDDPASLVLMRRECARRWAEAPRAILAITPQGRFADPRDEIVLRPGAAVVAAETPSVRVAALAVEYAFWTDQRPEVFVRLRAVEAPREPSLRGWMRAMTEAMEENAAALAVEVRSRDPGRFETLVENRSRGWSPYALWLRVTGRGTRIGEAPRRSSEADPRPRAMVGPGPGAGADS